MSDIEQMRKQAADARRLAKNTTDSHDRAVLHALADELELRATESERQQSIESGKPPSRSDIA